MNTTTKQNNIAIWVAIVMNLDADPRAVRRAQNAETQRMRRANRGTLDEENDQRRARRIIPGALERESDYYP